MEKLFSDFMEGKALFRSHELNALADKVISEMDQRQEEDTELWADRLAEDLSKATD